MGENSPRGRCGDRVTPRPCGPGVGPREGTAAAVGNPPRAAQREDMDSLQNTSSGGRSHPSSPAGPAAFGEGSSAPRPAPSGRGTPAPPPPARSAGHAWAPRAPGRASGRQGEGRAGPGEAPPAIPGSQAPPAGCEPSRPAATRVRLTARPLASLPASFPPVSGSPSYLGLLPGGCGWGTPPASGMRTWTRRPPFSTPRRRS